LATIALSEPESGVYFFLPVSQASLRDDGTFSLSAKKSMVTSAGEADLYVVNSRSTTSKNSMQSNFYVLTKNQKGMYVGEMPKLMGLRGNNSAPVEMKDCRIESEALIGNEGDGFKISREKLLPMGQLGISALQVGIAKAIYHESVEYVKNRFYRHNEKNLASFQSIQQIIAEMKIECDRAERSLEYMACQMEKGKLDMIALLEIKIIACEAVLKLANLCLNVCGGHAYSAHSPLERYIRDSKAGTVLGPTPELLKELIGKIILDIPTGI
jgi:alkylation response protein AidB-like acyl-CoA dehydrogenase